MVRCTSAASGPSQPMGKRHAAFDRRQGRRAGKQYRRSLRRLHPGDARRRRAQDRAARKRRRCARLGAAVLARHVGDVPGAQRQQARHHARPQGPRAHRLGGGLPQGLRRAGAQPPPRRDGGPGPRQRGDDQAQSAPRLLQSLGLRPRGADAAQSRLRADGAGVRGPVLDQRLSRPSGRAHRHVGAGSRERRVGGARLHDGALPARKYRQGLRGGCVAVRDGAGPAYRALRALPGERRRCPSGIRAAASRL